MNTLVYPKRLKFEVVSFDSDTRARLGRLTTRKAVVETPVFMPVGSLGSVKALDPEELYNMNFGLILGNTYHLMLRPGMDVIEMHGGLHAFMDWKKAVLTDSGGYQVFSLSKLRTIDDEGVCFRSHIDGDMVNLSPERAISVQETLGSDIMMVLDECPPFDAGAKELEAACVRTTKWAERCFSARTDRGGALFGIVQGGGNRECRINHLESIAALPFEGLAIGGVSVGEGWPQSEQVLSWLAPIMPSNRPRYLMGVGLPQDIIRAVGYGIDMFDCVVPTRNARNGQLFTWEGPIQIRHAAHRLDTRPVDEHCPCPACRRFSRSYLRHLYMSNEILGMRLNTLHNLTFYAGMMQKIRDNIRKGCYEAWSRQTLERLGCP